MKDKISKAVKYIFIIIVLILLDQVTKDAAVKHLMGSDPYVLIDNVLELLYVENRGAAFGMMKGMRTFFLLFAPAVSLVFFALILRMPDTKRFLPLRLAFTAIIAGAAGNFIDRLRQAYVVDFIYFKPIDFPVFNVADIYVTCAAFLLVFLVMFYYKDEELKQVWPEKKNP